MENKKPTKEEFDALNHDEKIELLVSLSDDPRKSEISPFVISTESNFINYITECMCDGMGRHEQVLFEDLWDWVEAYEDSADEFDESMYLASKSDEGDVKLDTTDFDALYELVVVNGIKGYTIDW